MVTNERGVGEQSPTPEPRDDVETVRKHLAGSCIYYGPNVERECLEVRDALDRITERLATIQRERDAAMARRWETKNELERAEARIAALTEGLREIAGNKDYTERDLATRLVNRQRIARTLLADQPTEEPR